MNKFRELTKKEEEQLRIHTRATYIPLTPIKKIWHPVVQRECMKINKEYKINMSIEDILK